MNGITEPAGATQTAAVTAVSALGPASARLSGDWPQAGCVGTAAHDHHPVGRRKP
jgi:hypothetical protein